MGRLFGTDGVRGVANIELTAQLAFQLGQAGAKVLTKTLSHKPTILVGKDTRISGDMLEAALAAGICSVGAQVISLGVVPTPAVAHLVRSYGADAGVVISASHNPYEYNGIKFFDSQGYKLKDEIEDEIEAMIAEGSADQNSPVGGEIGRYTQKTDATQDYVDFVTSAAPEALDGLKIVIDCANGASYSCAPAALKALGAEVLVIHNTPDGININADCGSTHMGSLCAAVKETGADIGLAFDGDADRMLAVDENGDKVSGDEIMMICAKAFKEAGKLKNDTVVATVMSNLGFFIAAKKYDINALQTKVGDRYVLEQMREGGYSLGGEESGHIILLDYNTTGDGLLSAIMLLGVLKQSGQTLSELRKIIHILPQVLINAKVSNANKYTYDQDPVIAGHIAELEKGFSGGGRVLIRPSGTEPVVRVMIEGDDYELIKARARELADLIEQKLG